MHNTEHQSPQISYHHGNLRQALLDAAVRQLNKGGTASISLRALAREVGVSQTAPYRHFPNKNLLLVAMAVDGFRQLEQSVKNASDSVNEGDKALIAAAESYVAFAAANPELYRLMFGPALNEWRKPEFMHGVPPAAFASLIAIVEKGMAQGHLTDSYPAWFLAKNCWAQIHGHASLLIDGLLDLGTPEGSTFDLEKSLRLSIEGKRP